MDAIGALNELAVLAARSVGARACLTKFLDQQPVLATFEIDHAATMRTGNLARKMEASEALICCLIAARTAHGDADLSEATHPYSPFHELTPRETDGG